MQKSIFGQSCWVRESRMIYTHRDDAHPSESTHGHCNTAFAQCHSLGAFQMKVQTSRYIRPPSLTQLHTQDRSLCVCGPLGHPSRAQSRAWVLAPLQVGTDQHQVALWLREALPPLWHGRQGNGAPQGATSALCTGTCHGGQPSPSLSKDGGWQS